MRDFYTEWDKANPFLAAEKEKMHAELRKMYAGEKMSKKEPEKVNKKEPEKVKPEIDYPTFQEALDAALAMGEGTLLNVKNCTASATVRLPGKKTPAPPEAPPGVSLLPQGKIRVGDTIKDEYLDQLREALGDGCISLDEFSARSDAIMAASTREHLDLFTRDLPARKKKEVTPVARTQPSVFCWLLNLAMILLPVCAGMGLLLAGGHITAAVTSLVGGIAALLLTLMGKTGID